MFFGAFMGFNIRTDSRSTINRKEEYFYTIGVKVNDIELNATILCSNYIASYLLIRAVTFITKEIKPDALVFVNMAR